MSRFSRFVIGWLHPAAAAFQLLTCLPVKTQVAYEGKLFQRSVVYYPFTGLVIGLLLAIFGAAAVYLLPVYPAALLMVGFWVYLTGGLHMDGLMDTADGLLSWRPRERMLEIMKDSRVGAMGVIACVLQLAAKWSLCAALLQNGTMLSWAGLLTAPVWARAFMAASMVWWPYARGEGGGMGSAYRGVRARHVAASLSFALLAQLLVGLLAGVPVQGAILLTVLFGGCTLLLGLLLARRMALKLDGLTGDTYGALCEMIETGLMVASVILVTSNGRIGYLFGL